MSNSEKDENVLSLRDEWLKQMEETDFGRIAMNKLIMNYLVTEGFKEAAKTFQQESGVSPNADLTTMDDRINIREAIIAGRIHEANVLINQLYPELLDNDRYLYFHVQQLNLIELIRENRVEEALAFAQSHLSESGEEDPNVLTELERTVALLAFENPAKSPFADLLESDHRAKVASEVNTAILKLEHQENTASKMTSLLKMMLWAQKKLNKKHVKYPRMTDFITATIEDPKQN